MVTALFPHGHAMTVKQACEGMVPTGLFYFAPDACLKIRSFCRSFFQKASTKRRLFEKRRHPKTFIF
ncbi:hypothetical protein [Komagataeibacter diospyri]|uniref:hypothetical protein n=1 Tax=Komagataeibacter diospyri TaxID=1932662 RepID=UPI0037565D41